eukprot:Gb_34506 [translate_table: standard]
MRKGDKEDRIAMAYLGNFYTDLRQLNDGPEGIKKVPKYIKKQWRELEWMEDDKTSYASLVGVPSNRKHVPSWPHPGLIEKIVKEFKEKHWPDMKPYRLACSPRSLLVIRFPGMQEKSVDSSVPPSTNTSNKPEVTSISSTLNTSHNVVVTMPPLMSPLTMVSFASPQPVVTEVPLTQWFETDPSLESALAIVPSLALKKVKGKKRGHFNPSIQISDDALTTKAQREKVSLNEKITLLLSEIDKLNAFPPKEQSKLVVERCISNLPRREQHWKEGYQELSKVTNVEQRASKEIILCQQHKGARVSIKIALRIGSLVSLDQEMSKIKMKLEHSIDERTKVLAIPSSPSPLGLETGERVLEIVAIGKVQTPLTIPIPPLVSQVPDSSKEETESRSLKITMPPLSQSHVQEQSALENQGQSDQLLELVESLLRQIKMFTRDLREGLEIQVIT